MQILFFQSVLTKRISAQPSLLAIGLIFFGFICLAPLNGFAQDDKAEDAARNKRSKKSEQEAKTEQSYKGSSNSINHSGGNTNDVKVGEEKVGNNIGKKEGSKMNSYDGERKVDKSKSVKESSQRISKYTGDMQIPQSREQLPRHDSYVPMPTNQAAITSQKIQNYTGDIDLKKSKQEAPRYNAEYIAPNEKIGRQSDKKISKYEGDIIVDNSKAKAQDKERAEYTGDIVVNDSKLRKKDKEIANYTGDIVLDNSKIRKKDKEIANYTGDIVVNDKQLRINDKRRANYTGDLPNNYLEKRAAYREEKNRKLTSYSGDMSVRSLQSAARKVRIKQKKMANYQGDIIVKRVKKGMHPSAVYQGGNTKNSYSAKEKYRKRILKKYGKTEGIEDANYMKQKYQKPKHDKKEAEIWY